MTKTKNIPGEIITENNNSTPINHFNKTIFSAYSPKRKVSISFAENGRTKQAFREECDINTIMARYMKTGILDHVKQGVAQYLDVTGADFQDAQNLISGANSMFQALPSAVREQFENNPAYFLEFMENPENHAKAREMGLLAAQAETSNPPTGSTRSVEPAQSSTNVEVPKPGGAPTQTPSV